MNIKCPFCNGVSEAETMPEMGETFQCPYCSRTFQFGQEISKPTRVEIPLGLSGGRHSASRTANEMKSRTKAFFRSGDLKWTAYSNLAIAVICGFLALFNFLLGWSGLPDPFDVKDSFYGNIAELQAAACVQVHACFKTLLCIARLFLGWLFTKAAICLGKLSLKLLAKAKGDATVS